MKRIHISLILSFCLILGGPLGMSSRKARRDVKKAAQPVPATADERYVFLDALMERVEFNFNANVVQLGFLEDCFRVGPEHHKDCAKEMQKIRTNVAKIFPKLNQHIFNYSLLSRAQLLLSMYSEQSRLKKRGKIAVGRHFSQVYFPPIKEQILEAPTTRDLPVWSEIKTSEMHSALKEEGLRILKRDSKGDLVKTDEGKAIPLNKPYRIDAFLELLCEDFVTTHSRILSGDLAPTLCTDLDFRMQYNEFTERYSFINVKKLSVAEYQFFNVWMSSLQVHLGRYTNGIKKRFMKHASLMPYIPLVGKSNPSDNELAEVFAHMTDNAHEERTKIKKLRKQALSGPGEIDKALSFMSFPHVVDNVIEDKTSRMKSVFGETNFLKVSSELYEDYAGLKTSELLWDLAYAIGSTLACYIPATKGFQVLKLSYAAYVTSRMSWLKVFCVAGTTLYWNSYFYIEAQENYERVWHRVFSTSEGRILLAELDELSSAEFDLLLNLIMYPVGVFSIKQIVNVTGKLSKGSQTYLSKVLKRSSN